MMGFLEYLEWQRGRGLPDTNTLMRLAGLTLHTPTKKQMGRFIDRAKDRLVVTMPLVPGEARPMS